MKADERQPRRRKATAADVPPQFDPRNLLQLVEGSTEGMIAVDGANRVLFANAYARRVLGAASLPAGTAFPEIERLLHAHALPLVGPDGVARHFEIATHEITWDGASARLISLRDITSTRTLEGHLTRVNRLYAALGQTAGAVAGASDERELFEDVCRIAVAFGGFRLAWVARASRDSKSIERAAVAGGASAYLDQLNLSLEPGADGEFGPLAQALRIGVPYVCNDFASDPSTRGWQESAAKHDLASFALCPIQSGGAIAGLLCVYASEAGYFVPDLLTLLNQLAAEISVGLDRLAGRAARRRAEQALSESESRFRQMAGASRHVFWMRDVTSGEVLYVSPAFELVYGRPAEAAVANPTLLHDMVHPDDRARAAALLARGLRGESACDTYRIIRHDGRICHVEEEVFPIFEAGRLVRLTGSIADISDRHAMEDQSRLFRRLVESSSEAFYALRPDDGFRIVFLNEAGVRHYGVPLDKLLGTHIWEWNTEMTPEKCRTIWQQVREQKSLTFETRHRRGDGTVIQVEVTATCVQHADVELCAGYFRDISARARADAVLRENEEKFRAVFDEGTDALLMIEPVTRAVIDCNTRAVEMFEAGRKEKLIGPAAPLLRQSTGGNGDWSALEEEISRSGKWSRELECATLKGRRVWGAVAARQLTIAGHNFHLLRINDVTERRRLIELLSATQELAKVGGWEYHTDEDRLTLTAQVYRLLGVPADSPLTLSDFISHYHPANRPAITAALEQCMRKGTPFRLEVPLVTASGREIRVRADGQADLAGGKPWRIYGLLQDITSEHEATTALHEREERLREHAMLLDEANDAIILRALDGTILFWNRGAERLLGWKREEALGRKAEELYFKGLPEGEAAQQAVLERVAWNGEIEHLTRDDTRIAVESRCTLIRDHAGNPKAILTINTDLTEKKRIDAGILRAQRLESIGTLAGGIAHDLNNILAPIVLCGDMLRTRFAGAPEEELIETICASARRGADVVRQVLSFARGVESTRVPVNFRHLFPDVRKIVVETFPRSIRCEAVAPADLWNIFADPTQLHQVLLNLCINSSDAMPNGGSLRFEAANVELDATFAGLLPEARPGAYVRVKVTDTGMGIPENIRHRIFDPFFTTKGPGKGTGLGLSTVLAIVRSHGGFVNVESEVGRGTTFILHFPAETHSVAPPAPSLPVDLPRGNGELILVIDDELSVRSIIRQSFENSGYRVVTATDGAEGITQFVQHKSEIALVLTDLMMPVMDGVAAIKALQRVAPGVRIIAMSGVAEHPDSGDAVPPEGAVRFLLKPFTLETLLNTVRLALQEPAPTMAPTR